jgi:hypothetical protein
MFLIPAAFVGTVLLIVLGLVWTAFYMSWAMQDVVHAATHPLGLALSFVLFAAVFWFLRWFFRKTKQVEKGERP